ncbi:MAG: hypothetical protein LBC20_07750 [Planctomycetaceae bacterium]|jgi:hypothetical protein|nr:hypothetical protein [Planctomycetaceae bacterium]
MKKFLYRFVLPAIVLAIVYHVGYSTGRTSGIQSTSVMPQVTSSPQSTPPASIASPTLVPKIIETSDKLPTTVKRNSLSPVPSTKTVTGANKPSKVQIIRETPEGLVVERRSARPSPSVKSATQLSESVAVESLPKTSKAVFRVPDPQVVQSELQPLKVKPTPDVPLIAKPATAPKDSDCGCGSKK